MYLCFVNGDGTTTAGVYPVTPLWLQIPPGTKFYMRNPGVHIGSFCIVEAAVNCQMILAVGARLNPRKN